jgi:ubiquinone/menaquinone biosynthesis C-methylase UbiE
VQDIIRTTEARICCDPEWEAAYRRFETAEEEIAKFAARLRAIGASGWSRSDQIVEIFCGRGNGLIALEQLGFRRLEGVDLSEDLIRQYKGPAQRYVSDCRKLPFSDQSRDTIIVQGGLHHLPAFPGDLVAVLQEVQRVLRPGGRFVVVEPWRTPFLTFVHFVSEKTFFRYLWQKLDALAVMTEHERITYEQWLNHPQEILTLFDEFFTQRQRCISFGKLRFEGIRGECAVER